MKKLALMLLLCLAVTGCQPIPAGVQSTLYTAELTLEETVKDSIEKTSIPWIIAENATIEEKLATREAQVELLIRIMDQANKNLDTVVEWFRTGKEPVVDGQ